MDQNNKGSIPYFPVVLPQYDNSCRKMTLDGAEAKLA